MMTTIITTMINDNDITLHSVSITTMEMTLARHANKNTSNNHKPRAGATIRTTRRRTTRTTTTTTTTTTRTTTTRTTRTTTATTSTHAAAQCKQESTAPVSILPAGQVRCLLSALFS